LGLATAEAFITVGVPDLMLVGRDEMRGRAVASRLLAVAPASRVRFISADCSVSAEAERAVWHAEEVVGGIDVLVTATGATVRPDLLHNLAVSGLQRTLCALMSPTLLLTHLVLPGMRARRSGVIVNVASDAARAPAPGHAVVGAAMAALVMFSKVVALEGKRDGIRVNVLTPSLIEGTSTTQRILADGYSSRLFEKARAQADLGREHRPGSGGAHRILGECGRRAAHRAVNQPERPHLGGVTTRPGPGDQEPSPWRSTSKNCVASSSAL
jgi:NAD(P)-dependent dehydrogenase (short-subunit alcohol dehydrogenase family)